MTLFQRVQARRNTLLSKQIGALDIETLMRVLTLRSQTGSFTQALFNGGLFVVRLLNKVGRVVRGYGKTFMEAVRSLVYELFCGGGKCEQ